MITINFLTERTYESYTWILKEGIALVASVVIVLVLVEMDRSTQEEKIEQRQQHISVLKKKLGGFERKNKIFKQRKKDLALLKKKYTEIAALYKGRGATVQIFEKLQVITPKYVWFNTLSLKSNQLTLDGAATNATEVAHMMTQLKLSNEFDQSSELDYNPYFFNNVKLKSVSLKGKLRKQAFTLSARVNRHK